MGGLDFFFHKISDPAPRYDVMFFDIAPVCLPFFRGKRKPNRQAGVLLWYCFCHSKILR